MQIREVPGHVPQISKKIDCSVLHDQLKAAQIQYLVTLPESPYEELLKSVQGDGMIRVIQVCRESEGIAICSGLYYGGAKSAWLASFKGFYNSIDSILGVAFRTQSSFLMMISEAGTKTDSLWRDPENGRHSEALLKCLDIPYCVFNSTADLSVIPQLVSISASSVKPIVGILRF